MMGTFADWLLKNKEWLLSGIGIAVPLAIFGWIKRQGPIQQQRSGQGSLNIGGEISG
jgi:hypothetical protein